MNQNTIVGLLAGFVLVVGIIAMASDHIGAFFNLPGLIVVIGGTLAATYISRPVADVQRLLRNLPALFRDPPDSFDDDAAQLLQFATRYRHGNLRAAERELAGISNPFLHAGLRRVTDRGALEDLTKSLQYQISAVRTRDQGEVQILYAMSTFAPAFGMLGTLFGLVHMLSGLGSSGLDEIGGTMAFAMITTVYGIIASNLLFKPLAIKLERRSARRIVQMTALMEGIVQIHGKRHPMLIKETLESFFSDQPATFAGPGPLTLVKA
ncbi:MAG: MotA/TolQ/ExbB proton channel family protein [Thiogranum sp.]|nr:MotA/TolQ/ExbB proton channel family protein [Thiogranum sp.]